MKLLNFGLGSGTGTIVIRGLGHEWDLHNFAKFGGFSYDALRSSLSFFWEVPPAQDNPWGSPGNVAPGCVLVFSDVTMLKMSSKDHEMPLSEDNCVSDIARVVPGEAEYPLKDLWTDDEVFNILITLQSGRTIEIAAATAELRAQETRA